MLTHAYDILSLILYYKKRFQLSGESNLRLLQCFFSTVCDRPNQIKPEPLSQQMRSKMKNNGNRLAAFSRVCNRYYGLPSNSDCFFVLFTSDLEARSGKGYRKLHSLF